MIWKPNPGPQEELLTRSEYELLYGGARGGGKTDAGIIWLTDLIDHPRYRALVVRKNAEDLADWVDRAERVFAGLGGKPADKPRVFTFPSGAKIRTGHLKDDNAYTKYQGHEYHRMLIEELTQIPEERRYLMLIGSCRTSIPELRPQVLGTTNPGGVGHSWVKERFIDPAPWGTPFQDPESGRWRIFIPAKVEDNPKLMEADPEYVRGLDALKATDIELWKAWRLGDWDVFAGQFFREFRHDRHVIPYRKPDPSWVRAGGMDWGRTASFVYLTVAIESVNYQGTRFNRAYVFVEVDGTEKTPREWAAEIKQAVDIKTVSRIYGDPAMFTKGQDNSTSIADQFKDEGIWISPASNDRIGGWTVLHQWLSDAPDGKPYLLFMDNCRDLIKTLPSLVHDEHRVEDVDTDGPDHWADALRYVLKHLKWIDGKVGGVKYRQPVAVKRVENPVKAPSLDAFAAAGRTALRRRNAA